MEMGLGLAKPTRGEKRKYCSCLRLFLLFCLCGKRMGFHGLPPVRILETNSNSYEDPMTDQLMPFLNSTLTFSCCSGGPVLILKKRDVRA